MLIGLIDVDSHNFPNLALMRISAYHKSIGDNVEWWQSDLKHYDVVYMSKVFSDAYTKDRPMPINCDKLIRGGSGYCIKRKGKREVFEQRANNTLPIEIERMFPDYSIYPQYQYAVAMTSRGCPRGCSFCHVAAKEGRCAVKVADVKDFWNGQKEIVVLDPNITACADKRDLMRQYRETGALIDFSQGLDIRCTNDDDIADLNAMRLKNVHFAWDDPREDLRDQFARYAKKGQQIRKGEYGTVYVLTNYNSTLEQDLYRIYTLRDMGFLPDVRIYDKPHAPAEVKQLQRWCNCRRIYRSEPDFNNYKKNKPDADPRQMRLL